MFLMNYFYLNLINSFFIVLFVLMSVAFYTLFERKLLGYIQIRKGPNKVGMIGLFQPFSDAIKLLTKEKFFLNKIYLFYYLGPVLSFLVAISSWMLLPLYVNSYSLEFGMLILFCCFGLSGYSGMIGGWSASSLYSLIGSIRSVAQSISYEVSMILLIFSGLFLIEGYSFNDFFLFQKYCMFMIMMMPIYFSFFISIVAELNRSPFDLIEGESELVSGFNTEYFSSEFILIFLGEYAMIIFSSILMVVMFMGMFNLSSIMFIILVVMYMYMFVLIRGIMPRIRYDQLMYLCWKSILLISLNFLMFFLGFKFLLYWMYM